MTRIPGPGQVAPATVLNLPTVTVGTLEDGMAPKLTETFDRQQLVDHTGAQQHAPRCDGFRAQADAKSAARPRDDADQSVAHLDVRVAGELLATDLSKLFRRCSVARDEVVNLLRGRVASRARITEQHALAAATERERSREATWSASHDDDVIGYVGAGHTTLLVPAGPR